MFTQVFVSLNQDFFLQTNMEYLQKLWFWFAQTCAWQLERGLSFLFFFRLIRTTFRYHTVFVLTCDYFFLKAYNVLRQLKNNKFQIFVDAAKKPFHSPWDVYVDFVNESPWKNCFPFATSVYKEIKTDKWQV